MDAAPAKLRWTLPNGEEVLFPAGMRQEAALRLVEGGERLLDVGCGRGAVAAALATRFREVHGVDGDESSLAAAGRRGVRAALVDLDSEPLPYPDGHFDAALCLEVVEHVRDPRLLACELARVLRPGGRLYLSTPNIRFVGYVARLALTGRFPLTSEDAVGFQGGHVHFFTFADVEALLAFAGFGAVRHHGLTTPRRRRSIVYRAAGGLARELLAVGIFTVAVRTDAPPPPPPEDLRERRAY